MKFSGFSSHNLDSKGRVFVPKRIQLKLPADAGGQYRVVLGPGIENCVNLYTPEGWEQREAKLETQPFAAPAALKMQRFVFGNTFETSLDKSFRLLIPDKLRKWAGLDGEVALVGVQDRVELWDADQWRRQEAEAMAEFEQFAPRWAAGGWDGQNEKAGGSSDSSPAEDGA